MCWQVASGRSLVQSDPTECGVSEFDCEASTMRRLWPSRSCSAMEKNYTCLFFFTFRRFRSKVQCRPSIWTAHTNYCDMPSLKTYALLDFCIFFLRNKTLILLLTSVCVVKLKLCCDLCKEI